MTSIFIFYLLIDVQHMCDTCHKKWCSCNSNYIVCFGCKNSRWFTKSIKEYLLRRVSNDVMVEEKMWGGNGNNRAVFHLAWPTTQNSDTSVTYAVWGWLSFGFNKWVFWLCKCLTIEQLKKPFSGPEEGGGSSRVCDMGHLVQGKL